MFKNKLLQLGVIILIALALIAVVVVILFNTIGDTVTPKDSKTAAQDKVESVDTTKYTPDELVEMTSNMNDITTNLANDDLVQISLAFQLNSVEAKEEFDKLNFVTLDAVNKILADMNPEDVKGSKGNSTLKAELMNKINPKLTTGKLLNVYITKIILP